MAYYKNRVQLLNPVTKRWVKLDTVKGGIIGHKTDTLPYKNVMTIEQQEKDPDFQQTGLIKKVIKSGKIKIDPKYAKRKIQCDCGHYSKQHYLGEGSCDKCGCSWYYPNIKWIKKQQVKGALKLIQEEK